MVPPRSPPRSTFFTYPGLRRKIVSSSFSIIGMGFSIVGMGFSIIWMDFSITGIAEFPGSIRNGYTVLAKSLNFPRIRRSRGTWGRYISPRCFRFSGFQRCLFRMARKTERKFCAELVYF